MENIFAFPIQRDGSCLEGHLVGIHREGGMILQIVWDEACATALYRRAVNIVASVVHVILQVLLFAPAFATYHVLPRDGEGLGLGLGDGFGATGCNCSRIAHQVR